MDLVKLAESNNVAKAVFENMAGRRRYRKYTNLRFLRRQLEANGKETIAPEKLMSVFKTLEQMGLGSIVIGRRKNPTKFIWNYNLKDVAQVAAGKKAAGELGPIFATKGRHKQTAPRIEEKPAESVPQEEAPQLDKSQIEVLIIENGSAQRVKISSEKMDTFFQVLKAFES
jgi:hypothetical protein